MQVLVGREYISHDDKVDLAGLWHLQPVQTVEPGKKWIWIANNVLQNINESDPPFSCSYFKVKPKNLSQKLVFPTVHRLHDEPIVLGVVKETSTLPRRSHLWKDVATCQRHQIICSIDGKGFPQDPKYPRTVILKLEFILWRGRQLTVRSLAAVAKAKLFDEAKISLGKGT